MTTRPLVPETDPEEEEVDDEARHYAPSSGSGSLPCTPGPAGDKCRKNREAIEVIRSARCACEAEHGQIVNGWCTLFVRDVSDALTCDSFTTTRDPRQGTLGPENVKQLRSAAPNADNCGGCFHFEVDRLEHTRRTARRVARLVEAGSSSAPRITASAAIREEVFVELQVFRSAYGNTIQALRVGILTPEAAIDSLENLLTSGYEQAYRQGLRSLGVTRFGTFDQAFVNNAVANEMRFVRQFVSDVATGSGTIPYGTRAAYYARGYESLYQVGQVQGLPWETDIYWKLGDADHCQDCVSLSEASPFSKATIPIVPGSGGTQCLYNCGCRLEFRQRPPRSPDLSTSAGLERAATDVLSPIPEGLRSPVGQEIETIRGLWGDIQSNRTAVRFAPAEQKAAHVAARREANADLIDYLDDNSIHWTRGAEDTLFNPPPGGGVGVAVKTGRTGIESLGPTVSNAGRSIVDPSLHRQSIGNLGEPDT